MLRIIIACALVSLAAAAVIPDDTQAKIVSYHNENDGSGNYNFSFETSNGIIRKETGRLINAGAENQYVEVLGSFFYTDTDGQQVEVNYRADENGYHILSKPIQSLESLLQNVPIGAAVGSLGPNVVATLLGK